MNMIDYWKYGYTYENGESIPIPYENTNKMVSRNFRFFGIRFFFSFYENTIN